MNSIPVVNRGYDGRRKKTAVILSDSRGARLGQELRALRSDYIHFRVRVNSGAKLAKLWEFAEYEILFNQPDVIFLYGGVCDLTDRFYTEFGERYFWTPFNIKDRVESIIDTMDMDSIMRNHLIMNTQTKLVFIPECGLDLLRYNGIEHPAPWRCLVAQADLDYNIRRLQTRARVINNTYGIGTPRTLDLTHSRRNGYMMPVYSRLYDGLHPPRSMVRNFARVIHDFTKYFLIDNIYD